jgi:hypothetical protein
MAEDAAMKTEIYGPLPYETEHLAELLKLVPLDAKHVVVQAPHRRPVDIKACQRPGCLELAASVDNSKFIFYSHHPTKGTDVKFQS